MSKLEDIKKKANNVLYFDDSSDYGTALWEILLIIDDKYKGIDEIEEYIE